MQLCHLHTLSLITALIFMSLITETEILKNKKYNENTVILMFLNML